MFRLACLLVVVLSASAVADAPAPGKPAPAARSKDSKVSKVPLRVMRILADSQQAVLFDVARKAHVMVEVGMQIAGYTVIEIDDDTVTLVTRGKQLVLAAPAPLVKEEPVKPEVPGPEHAIDGEGPTSAPVDPYADDLGKDTPTANTAPVDPYADDLGKGAPTVAIVTPAPTAPSAPAATAKPTTPTVAPATATSATVAPSTSAAASATVAAATSAAPAIAPPAAPATPAIGPVAPSAAATASPSPPPAVGPMPPAVPSILEVALPRAEVAAALDDFGTLVGALGGTFMPTGVRIDRVTAGSVFAKAGLRVGDVVTAVDGKPVRSLDDAADLYARAATTRAMTAQLVRGGQAITLKLAIR
jgi:membrane-associated protease RseP (regulator of RpoE activity)